MESIELATAGDFEVMGAGDTAGGGGGRGAGGVVSRGFSFNTGRRDRNTILRAARRIQTGGR